MFYTGYKMLYLVKNGKTIKSSGFSTREITRRNITMTTCEQKIYAFVNSLEIIEELARRGTLSVSEKSFQALYNTYEELVSLFSVSGASLANDFLVSQT
jgi:hypothetical protein